MELLLLPIVDSTGLELLLGWHVGVLSEHLVVVIPLKMLLLRC